MASTAVTITNIVGKIFMVFSEHPQFGICWRMLLTDASQNSLCSGLLDEYTVVSSNPKYALTPVLFCSTSCAVGYAYSNSHELLAFSVYTDALIT